MIQHQNVFAFCIISQHWFDTDRWNPCPWKLIFTYSILLTLYSDSTWSEVISSWIALYLHIHVNNPCVTPQFSTQEHTRICNYFTSERNHITMVPTGPTSVLIKQGTPLTWAMAPHNHAVRDGPKPCEIQLILILLTILTKWISVVHIRHTY